MKKLLAVVAVVLAAVIVFFLAKPTGPDLDGLDGGPWTLVLAEANGKKVPREEWQGIKVQFTKDTVVWSIPTPNGVKQLDGEFRIDAAKKPKAIDLEHPFSEEPSPGIYEFREGALVLCMGQRRRPTGFAGPGQIVLVFARQ